MFPRDSNWSAIADRMRPFVRKRVRCDADADDVMQELFLRITSGIQALENDDRLDAWLYQIARNLITDRFRREQRASDAVTSLAESAHEADDCPEAAVRDLAGCLTPLVQQLAPTYRAAVTLVELDGLSNRTAAQQAGISEAGMKSRVQRGRAMLRGLLEACCRMERDRTGAVSAYEKRGGDGCDIC